MKKVLLIGANGFLGSNIIQLWKENIEYNNEFLLHTGDIQNSNIPSDMHFEKIDITKPQEVNEKIIKLQPNIVLLTAAMTNVDQNEINQNLAVAINTNGPINIAKTCEKIDSKLVFLSTDFVFDGKKPIGESYTENDNPTPISFYGKTKYNAEIAILNSEIPFLICRTAVLYGWNPEKLNFITWILRKLEKNQPISIVTDQINNATYIRNLAEILLKLIQKNAEGIFHTAGSEALNRYEMALKCAEHFNYSKDLITPIEEIEQKAFRPKNAALDISKLKNLMKSDLDVYNLDEGLERMRKSANGMIP